MDRVYHFSDVNEKGNCYQLVLLLMDRGYFVMQMNWPILVMDKSHKLIKWCQWIVLQCFGDVNKYVFFSDMNKQG
jgi:hypothetical protein